MAIQQKFRWRAIDHIEDKDDDAIDIEIILEDGARYVPTFFTLSRIARVMRQLQEQGKQADPGESVDCANGVYFWAHDMVIVKELTPKIIEATVRHLIEDHPSLDQVFERMSPEGDIEEDEN